MKYEVSRSKFKILSERIRLLTIIVLGLVVSNIISLVILGWFVTHPRTIISPVVTTEGFIITGNSVDASYLRQMALTFISARLNNSPNTLKNNHNLLLNYLSPKFFSKFKAQLDREGEYIVKQQVSSVFYPSQVFADPNKNLIEIKGELKCWAGSTEIKKEDKIYRLEFEVKNGQLLILDFRDLSK